MLATAGFLVCACGSSKTLIADLNVRFFLLLKIKSTTYFMRKIIITSIITVFMTVPFESAKGQTQWEYRVVSANFPTVNVLTGVNAKISLGIWRFEPFIEIGRYRQMLEEQMVIEGRNETEGFHSPRFANGTILELGTRVRITNNDRIKLGVRGPFRNQFGSYHWLQSYLGYIRSINLSQRMSLDLSMSHAFRWHLILGSESGSGQAFVGGYIFEYLFVDIGSRLNFEIIRNVKLYARFIYTGRYRFVYGGGRGHIENVSGEKLITRNLLDFSIGIHAHLGRHRPAEPRTQRPPRQRVAPHQRALPCPPGQMRHQRSWDRPSPIFNHPSGR